jgi:arginyl-tRNA synthetase
MKGNIEQEIKDALQSLGAGDVAFTVERPADFAHGDYATNAALAAAKLLKKNPKDVAVELAQKLEGKVVGVKKIEVAGVGFINFTISGMTIKDIVHEAHEAGWGSNDLYKDKEVLVEYTSPNLFKPLHIGNLIGNILGESIARLFESAGAEVKRLNYPSDIGLTVAKGVWGLVATNGDPKDIQALGKAYVAGNAAYEDGSAKSEIEEINKALYEDTNSEWSTLRKDGIETSRKHLDALCEKLGTKFDKEFFESQSGPLGRDMVKANIGKVFEESEGAVVYKGEQDGLHTRVFLNSQGLPTYEAKEVGLFELKNKAYNDFDVSITVTGGEQREFFKVVFAAIKKMFVHETEGKVLQQISNGFLKLTTGKMSSRLGNVITGESLIEDLTKEARDREDVAIGAIKYTALKSGNGKDIVFDPAKSLSLEGDSGPYVQYALVRARSLLRKAADAEAVDPEPSGPGPLERLLIHFPEVVVHAAAELEPHYVVTYITEVAAAFNSWYAGERFIIDGKVSRRALAVIKAVENTLAQGLKILGIPTPEEM